MKPVLFLILAVIKKEGYEDDLSKGHTYVYLHLSTFIHRTVDRLQSVGCDLTAAQIYKLLFFLDTHKHL